MRTGCVGIATSTVKAITISGMVGTAGAITFDKELYKVLKNYDWFMIDPVEYMSDPVNSDEM